MESNNA